MKNPYIDLIKAVCQHGKPWRKWIVIYYLAYVVAEALLSISPYALGRGIGALQHFTPVRLPEVILLDARPIFYYDCYCLSVRSS
ncbi:MAG: hypothetical protein U1E78_03545 [Gammaproteobacteria bacterium]